MIPQDPMMLLSYVNLKLRDEYSSLEEFCDREDVDMEKVVTILKSIDYSYNRAQNQFK